MKRTTQTHTLRSVNLPFSTTWDLEEDVVDRVMILCRDSGTWVGAKGCGQEAWRDARTGGKSFTGWRHTLRALTPCGGKRVSVRTREACRA